MKKNKNKQPQNVPTRIDKSLLKQIQEKAQEEQRPIVVVLNRLINSGLTFEQRIKQTPGMI